MDPSPRLVRGVPPISASRPTRAVHNGDVSSSTVSSLSSQVGSVNGMETNSFFQHHTTFGVVHRCKLDEVDLVITRSFPRISTDL